MFDRLGMLVFRFLVVLVWVALAAAVLAFAPCLAVIGTADDHELPSGGVGSSAGADASAS